MLFVRLLLYSVIAAEMQYAVSGMLHFLHTYSVLFTMLFSITETAVSLSNFRPTALLASMYHVACL